MIHDVKLLLQLQYMVFKGGLKTAAKTSFITGCWMTVVVGPIILILVAISALIGLAAASVVSSMRGFGNLEWVGPALLLTLAVLIFSVSGFINAMSGLYLSGDLELLMAAPVDRRAIFIAKMLRGMQGTYFMLAIIGAPALIAYGIKLQFGILYFVLGIVALAGAPLLGTSLGALATMIVARFAPAGRVREAVSAFASLLGLAFYVVFRLWNVILRGNNAQQTPNINEVRGTIQTVLNAPIPTYWAGHALAAAGHNDVGASLLQLVVYLLLTFGTFVFVVVVANRLYAVGWLRIQGGGIAKRKRLKAQRPGPLAHLPIDFALVVKDWRLRTRDLRLVVQILSGIVTLIVWIFLIFFQPGSRGNGLPDQTFNTLSASIGGFESALLAAGILVVGVMTLGNVIATSVSMEGRDLWILKIAPVRAWHIIRGKLAAVALPFMALTTILLVGLAYIRHMQLFWVFYAWLCIQLLGLTNLCLGVCMSLPWAKLDWDDPKQMHAGVGGCFGFIEEVIYTVPAGLLLCVPLLLAKAAPAQLWQFTVLALAVSTLWSLLFIGLTVAFACRRWQKLGEVVSVRTGKNRVTKWIDKITEEAKASSQQTKRASSSN